MDNQEPLFVTGEAILKTHTEHETELAQQDVQNDGLKKNEGNPSNDSNQDRIEDASENQTTNECDDDRSGLSAAEGTVINDEQMRIQELKQEKERLEGILKRNKKWIAALHRYNDIKDIAQMLMGKLALIEGGTTKDMYQRFGLDLDD